MSRKRRLPWSLLGAFVLFGCASDPEVIAPIDEAIRPIAPVDRRPLELSFETQAVLPAALSPVAIQRHLRAQLAFAQGELGGWNAEARLGRATLGTLDSVKLEGDRVEIRYRARLPVLWPVDVAPPSELPLQLPRDVSFAALSRFWRRYQDVCAAMAVDPGLFWSVYSSRSASCAPSAEDVSRVSAQVLEVSPEEATPRTSHHPEFQEIWEDGVLEVLVVTENDPDTHRRLESAFTRTLAAHALGNNVAWVQHPSSAGDVFSELTAELGGGNKVRLNLLSVSDLRRAGSAFHLRFGTLSSSADVMLVDTPSNSGASLRTLAQSARFWAGQYLVLALAGGDAFVGVEDSLSKTQRALNRDDITGTRYLDVLTQMSERPLPADAAELDTELWRSFFELLLVSPTQPATFESWLDANDRGADAVVTTGLDDNRYRVATVSRTFSFEHAGRTGPGELWTATTALLDAGTWAVEFLPDEHSRGIAETMSFTATLTGAEGSGCAASGANVQSFRCEFDLTERKTVELLVPATPTPAGFVVRLTRRPSERDPDTTGPISAWSGVERKLSLTHGEEYLYGSPLLSAGRYVVELSGTGDVDLYVRRDVAPNRAAFDCRSISYGSSERCTVELTRPMSLQVLVHGFGTTNEATLRVYRQQSGVRR